MSTYWALYLGAIAVRFFIRDTVDEPQWARAIILAAILTAMIDLVIAVNRA